MNVYGSPTVRAGIEVYDSLIIKGLALVGVWYSPTIGADAPG